MKKVTFFLAVAGACLLASCAKTIEQPAPEEAVAASKVVTYIQANGNEDAAKASIDNSAAFTWSEGDKIAVFVGEEYLFSEGLDSGGSANANFAFTSSIDQDERANFALYPASLACDTFGDPRTDPDDCKASNLLITLPGSYNLSDIKGEAAPVFMIAENAPNTALAFKQLGALLRFKLVNVPKQTQYITFDFRGKKVQGEFTLAGVVAGTSAVATASTDDDDDIITVYNDDVFTTFQTDLRVNIPVPTGTYDKVTITTWDGEPGNGGHVINSLKTPIDASAAWAPARKAAHKRLVNLPVFGITVSNGVNAGTKAVFAPGNLQAVINYAPKYNDIVGSASSWSFAAHQYDAIGATMPKDVNPDDTRSTHSINSIQAAKSGDVIDLFAWIGQSATYEYEDDEKYGILFPSYSSEPRSDGTKWSQWVGTAVNESLANDWGQLEINDRFGAYPANTWRILTKDEWYKVMLNRGAYRLRGMITSDGTESGTVIAHGYIIAPDQYTHPEGAPEFVNAATNNTSYLDSKCSDYIITLEQWTELEEAGCVFFPLTNVRVKATNSETSKPGDGYYWTNFGASSGGNATAFAFNDINVGTSMLNTSKNTVSNKSTSKQNGCAVRLVRVVNDK